MKRPRLRRRWLVPLGVLGLPPLLWTVILILAPTEWARTKVVEQLGKATGRTIGLGRLRIGPLGDVRLADLEIGSPRSVHDPWLKIGTARINVSVLQLLVGQVEPTEIEVSGLSLRVHRRDDGSLELADLLQPGPAQAEVASADSASCSDQCEGPSGLTVLVRDATIRVIDEPSRTRLDFTGIEGRADVRRAGTPRSSTWAARSTAAPSSWRRRSTARAWSRCSRGSFAPRTSRWVREWTP